MSSVQDNAAHTCSYSCDRPECIKAQRDELAAAAAQEAVGEMVCRASGITVPQMYGSQLPAGTKLYAAPVTAAPGVDLYPIRYALQYAAAAARENTHTEMAEGFDALIRKIDASPKGGSEVVSDAMIHAALRVQYARAGSLWTGSEANPDFTDMRHILSAAMQAQAGDAEVQP